MDGGSDGATRNRMRRWEKALRRMNCQAANVDEVAATSPCSSYCGDESLCVSGGQKPQS